MKGIVLTIEIIDLLKRNRKVTTKLIAEELGVSIRTAQRYISELLNIPGFLYYDPKEHTYSLVENIRFTDVSLPKAEIQFLAAILEYVKSYLSANTGKQIDKILKNIFHLSSLEYVKFIENPKFIDIDKVLYNINKIEEAIKYKQVIKFTYEPYDKTYEVNPLKILIDNGFWYLLAYHDNILKKFSVDLIKDLEVLVKFFNFSQSEIDKMLDNVKSVWFSDNKKIVVTVEIKKIVAFYFKRKEIFPHQKIERELENGNLILNFYVTNEEEFLYFIRPWAEYLKVLKPEKFNNVIINFAKNILKKYEGEES